MKLLIATPLYPPDIGGPATYAKTLETELPQRGVDVVVVSFHAVRHFPKLIRHVVYMVKLFRAVRGVDIVLALDPVSVGLPATLIAFLLGKPLAVKIVGDYAWEQGAQRFGVKDNLDTFVTKPSNHYLAQVGVLRFVQKFVASHAKEIIVPSSYLRGIVSAWGISEKKISVVYNAYDGMGGDEDCGRLRLKYNLSGHVILSAGRLVPWKGFETLIRLMTEIVREYPDVTLYIAGSGPDEAPLKRLIVSEGMSHSVVMLGGLPHDVLMEYISAADCFVLNTGYEGLSHQLLEVLAIGTPIVTTRVGGNPELIENGQTGFLVPYDDAEEFRRAIRGIFEEPERARAMAKEGKAFVQGFTIARMVDGTLGVLKNITSCP